MSFFHPIDPFYYKNQYRIKSARMQDFDYSRGGLYFITICVRDMKCLLGEVRGEKVVLSDVGKIVKKCWLDMPKHFKNIYLDAYVIMPNHVHGIIQVGNWPDVFDHNFGNDKNVNNVETIHELSLRDGRERRNMLIPKIIGRFKMQSAKEINILTHSKGSFWQKNYYDRIIRDDDELYRVREYIKNNPIKWNDDPASRESLCSRAEGENRDKLR